MIYLEEMTDEELEREYNLLKGERNKLLREVDNIETEMIGFKEEIRKRREIAFKNKNAW